MNNEFLKILNLGNFISLDVETTGLDKKSDKIIEVSAAEFKNGIEINTYSELINPQKKISPFIGNLTGITNKDVLNKPTFDKIGNSFLDFIKGKPIVGHNIGFDISFINNELKNLSLQIDNVYICDTYFLSQIFLYDFDSFKLESLCAKLNISMKSSHRALDDARSSAYLFFKILDVIMLADLNTLHMLNTCMEKNNIYNVFLIEKILKIKVEESFVNDRSRKCTDNSYTFKSKRSDLVVDSVDDALGERSLLIRNNKKYKYRENQLLFSESCYNAIINNDILISEAGTGLGKTFGYLAASIINIDKKNIVVSTSTHNLQSQLLHKDLPSICELLNKDVKAIVIKGKNNYLCYSKLSELIDAIDEDFSNIEFMQVMSLIYWANETSTGDIAECTSFNIKRNRKIWDLVKFNKDTCFNHSINMKCFYNKIIEDSKDANLFIVNHALLASTIESQDYLFDKSSIYIIDEAHKFTENSRNHLTNSLSYLDIKREYESSIQLISKVINDFNLKSDIQDVFDLFIKKGLILIKDFKIFSIDFANSKIVQSFPNTNYALDIRYLTLKTSDPSIVSDFESIKKLIKEISNLFSKIKKLITLLADRELNNSVRFKIAAINNNYKKYSKIISEQLFNDNAEFILWMKIFLKNGENRLTVFNAAPFSIDKTMKKISNNAESLIFCSATLAIDGDFSFFVDETGLDNCMIDKNIKFKSFPSPFYYQDQIKLFLYNSNEDINSHAFISKIGKLILDLNNKINKRMLVLCTSFQQINEFSKILSPYNLLNTYYQKNTSSRENLLKQYIENENAILFGTASFWEGVDLPNDLLEILIILKVPFENPNNPVVGAKIDFYNQVGRNAFYEYQIPKAILKLKQGIGRLIRSDEDVGICILTDSRLISKNYGKDILESLPAESNITSDNNVIINKAETFLNV